ncbi:hypothetical protein Bhyg_13295 [Pseudolycoriella hygida]|uniref:Uncharacterized protein n=1 Tax=Pseudolycoriella hygida TaxID=35572 RepID=A0A9Q0MR21_9DIPT|nr:hypothetical protein Bhyg_13295 [Pseudolycoriella hygida]
MPSDSLAEKVKNNVMREASIKYQNTIIKQNTDDRTRCIEERVEVFEQKVTADMNQARDEDSKVMAAKINEAVASSIVNVTNSATDNRIDDLERVVRMNELDLKKEGRILRYNTNRGRVVIKVEVVKDPHEVYQSYGAYAFTKKHVG